MIGKAPIPPPFVWSVSKGEGKPRGLAWLALAEYLRRFYRIDRNGVTKDTLRHDRLEAIFHPPGVRISNLVALLEVVIKNPHLPQILTDVCQKTHMATPAVQPSPEECGEVLQTRLELFKRCARESLAIVDIIEIV